MKTFAMVLVLAASLPVHAEIQTVDSIQIDSATFKKGGLFSDPTLTIKSGKDTVELICRGYDHSVQIFSNDEDQRRVPLEIDKDECSKKLSAAADSAGHILVIEAHKSITIKDLPKDEPVKSVQ